MMMLDLLNRIENEWQLSSLLNINFMTAGHEKAINMILLNWVSFLYFAYYTKRQFYKYNILFSSFILVSKYSLINCQFQIHIFKFLFKNPALIREHD